MATAAGVILSVKVQKLSAVLTGLALTKLIKAL
jgi:hypothetical protein